MKKNTFYLLGIIITFLLSSCAAPLVFVEPQQIQPDVSDDIVIFKQDFIQHIEVDDSVLFFNSEIINLEKNFHLKDYYIKKGIRHTVDTFLYIKKTILPLTSGRAVKIIKDEWGEIMSVVVSFSEEEEDKTYSLSFFSNKQDGWFMLSGGGAYYNFRGKSYPLTVSTKGSCILMVKPPERSTIFTESFSIFKGWRKK